MSQSPDRPLLPSRQQVGNLREFLHARTYSAASVTIRLDGAPAHAAGSPLDDVSKVSDALYEIVDGLARRVLDAVFSGQSDAEARDAWVALLLVAQNWRDAPGLPADLKTLVDEAFPL
ncbi:hypothetical protein [Streptomyces sp. NBC_00102]|uniref:hypothetical protein n=1 Tax=Streptomyces sp. NBC_00102 TaxID=2975652 RepID=UPI00225BB379|nr:hypothetical protein [Streptomyces sp. NBC_00102]MCX5400672.1 hypothetical protein [Streptomyces sp. NBC_00102]